MFILSQTVGTPEIQTLCQDVYSKFVVDYKIIGGMVPMCKIPKFIVLLKEAGVLLNLCKYDRKRNETRPY
jgi:hypothetical protein